MDTLSAFLDRSDGVVAAALVFAGLMFLAFRGKGNENAWQSAVALGLSLPLVIGLFAIWAPLLYPGVGLLIAVLLLHPQAVVLLVLGIFVWWKFAREGFALRTSTAFALVVAGLAILGQIVGKFL